MDTNVRRYEPTEKMVLDLAGQITKQPAAHRWFKPKQRKPAVAIACEIVSGNEKWSIGARTNDARGRRSVLHTLLVALVHERDKCSCSGGPCPAARRFISQITQN
jgi:hypothetical protein